jgi:hypothetical protein
MAFDFPSSPAEGAIYAPPGGPQYQFSGGVWKQVAATGEVLNIVQTVITTSQPYVKPAGLKFLEVTVIGAGGGVPALANQAASNVRTGSGGGGGGTAIKLYPASALAASESITVGAAAVSGNGGASIFKSQSGGGGFSGAASGSTTIALGASFANGGPGGAAGGGDVNISGGSGEGGVACAHGTLSGYRGGGGASFLALTSPGRYVSTVDGSTGITPGGGAMGASARNNEGAVAGAAGGEGRVILKEYF